MKHRRWTAKQISTMRAKYPDTRTAELARLFKRPAYQVYQLAARLGLRKSAAYMASPAACRLRRGDNVGAPYRFRKGCVPPNKGLRRPGWFVGRMRETQFKKGQRPHTWVPVGTEVLDPGGYRKRKVSDDRTVPSRFNWAFVHILVWERENGPVPPAHAIAFRNGDKSDIRLANLELVSKREMLRRNSVHQLPKALGLVIQLRGALVRQINRRRTA